MSVLILFSLIIPLFISSVQADRESIVCETSWRIRPSECCPIPQPYLTQEQEKIYQNALEKFNTKKNGCKSWLPYFRKTLKVYRENGDVSVSALKAIFTNESDDKQWTKILDTSVRACVRKSESMD